MSAMYKVGKNGSSCFGKQWMQFPCYIQKMKLPMIKLPGLEKCFYWNDIMQRRHVCHLIIYDTHRIGLCKWWRKLKKRKSSSIASFKFESLPPTTAAAKYHAYRAYFAVQEWLGNSLQATDWGWEYTDDMLSPVYTDRSVAPESVLNMVSCGCMTGCGKRCPSRKAGLDCSVTCSTCIGQNCSNACPLDSD